MTSRVSPYSIEVQPVPMGGAPQSQACEWYSPKLCPISWAITRSCRLPLIQADDGLPPTLPNPHQPQALLGNA